MGAVSGLVVTAGRRSGFVSAGERSFSGGMAGIGAKPASATEESSTRNVNWVSVTSVQTGINTLYHSLARPGKCKTDVALRRRMCALPPDREPSRLAAATNTNRRSMSFQATLGHESAASRGRIAVHFLRALQCFGGGVKMHCFEGTDRSLNMNLGVFPTALSPISPFLLT